MQLIYFDDFGCPDLDNSPEYIYSASLTDVPYGVGQIFSVGKTQFQVIRKIGKRSILQTNATSQRIKVSGATLEFTPIKLEERLLWADEEGYDNSINEWFEKHDVIGWDD